MTISDELFDELKREALKIWETYDNTHGYVDEKLERINEIKNFRDNFGTLIGMFDDNNQRKLYRAVGAEGKAAITFWTGRTF